VPQVAAQVIGNDSAIAIGGMQGHFELHVFVPCWHQPAVVIKLLASASAAPRRECVAGIARIARQWRELCGADSVRPANRPQSHIGTTRRARSSKGCCVRPSLREVAREEGVLRDVSTMALDSARWPIRTLISDTAADSPLCGSILGTVGCAGWPGRASTAFSSVMPEERAGVLTTASASGRSLKQILSSSSRQVSIVSFRVLGGMAG